MLSTRYYLQVLFVFILERESLEGMHGVLFWVGYDFVSLIRLKRLKRLKRLIRLSRLTCFNFGRFFLICIYHYVSGKNPKHHTLLTKRLTLNDLNVEIV